MGLKLSKKLAEIIGIMMGDGSLYLDKYHKYQTIICFNKEEKEYLNYVKKLFGDCFEDYKFCVTEIKDEFLLRNTSVFVGKQLRNVGIMVGNKIKNKIIIPKWIIQDNSLLSRFIRGFFDTDGIIYCKYGKYAQIQFKLACKETIKSLHKALIKLDFHPTKIQKESFRNKYSWKIYLIRQKEIERFFKEIQPKNPKHKIRYNNTKKSGDARI